MPRDLGLMPSSISCATARIGKRQDGSYVHGQVARVDHCCNLCQMRGGDVNEKEEGPHTVPRCDFLIRL